jgi:hypothetical protein
MKLAGRKAALTELRPTSLAAVGLVWTLAASTASGWAQTRVGTEFRLQSTDMAVLESDEPRADFSCQVTPEKPSLGFDLRFHADYRVAVPVKVLADAGGRLRVLMRVTPLADSEEPVYLAHRFAVPNIPPPAKGEGILAGGFDLGFGRYRVDWMMRDGRGQICSSHWELEAKRGRGQRELPLTLEPNMIAERVDLFGDELPVQRDATHPLHVKILLNLSPAKQKESIPKIQDVAVLLSILHGITREPGVSRFTLVAFNMREQKIIYRQDSAPEINFAALGKAVQAPTGGTLNYRLLQDRQSETHFVTRLLTDELGTRTGSSDAIIIVGSKVTLEKKVPLESLKGGDAASCPIFYLNYNPNPIDEPWPDTIGSALKAYEGALAYNIVFPRDLGAAMRDMLSRVGRLPNSETNVGSLFGARGGAAFQR